MTYQKYINEWHENSKKIDLNFDGVMTLEDGFFVIRCTIRGNFFARRLTSTELFFVLEKQRETINNIR